MITYVYPGTVHFEGIQPWLHDDYRLLAARGYVVLLPSQPRSAAGPTDNPYGDLVKNVLAGVDEAIGLAIADPDRLGIMGHSFGGYAVYDMITHTNRFRAAVAGAGICNLTSAYGLFDAKLRHTDFPLDSLHSVSWSESGQLGLGKSFWEDTERYLKNSPILSVSRVETPLLIVQGDMDYVPIEQGEEFFTSLARRGKPVRFVRYWGEPHMILVSPANYIDYWNQIYDWFNEWLPARQ